MSFCEKATQQEPRPRGEKGQIHAECRRGRGTGRGRCQCKGLWKECACLMCSGASKDPVRLEENE